MSICIANTVVKFGLSEIILINISSYNYRENPIMIPIKDCYGKRENNNSKPSYKGYEATQKNPRISKQLLRKTFLIHQMDQEQVTGSLFQETMRLINTLTSLTYQDHKNQRER